MCPFASLDLHSLESRLREEKEEEFVLIKALCGLINNQVQVKICRRSASPVLVYGGASCESSSPSEAQSSKVVHLEEMKIVFINLKWINAKGGATVSGRGQLTPTTSAQALVYLVQ